MQGSFGKTQVIAIASAELCCLISKIFMWQECTLQKSCDKLPYHCCFAQWTHLHMHVFYAMWPDRSALMTLDWHWSLFCFLLITEGEQSRLQRNSSLAFRNHLFGIPTIFEKNFSFTSSFISNLKFNSYLKMENFSIGGGWILYSSVATQRTWKVWEADLEMLYGRG